MAQWIWYYGDYELYHSMVLHDRRQELGADYPVMWKSDAPWPHVEFTREYDSDRAGYLMVRTNGKGFVAIDGGDVLPSGVRHALPAGKHTVSVRVSKIGGLPCLYAQSDLIPSDGRWNCGHVATERQAAGCAPVYGDIEETPETFRFAYERAEPVAREILPGGALYDFGRELFGFLDMTGADAAAEYRVYYGESREEALDPVNATLRETVSGRGAHCLAQRAFRYVFVAGDANGLRVSAQTEMLPLPRRGAFKSEDEGLTRIWETSAYTFHLCSREFFLDGIKRDRWVWSGDAYQSCLLNRYLFLDGDIARRTLIALRGRDPVEEHINTILDYDYFWILGVWDYCQSYGDRAFLAWVFPKMRSLLDFTCEDERGFAVGRPGEWVFIDWADMDKAGALCAEQMLYCASLRVMAEAAGELGLDGSADLAKADALRENIERYFWDAEKGAYIDSFQSGKRNVTRFASILAIILGLADGARARTLLDSVLLNDRVPAITTPYFKFFEMDALCRMGEVARVIDEVRGYWGGMIELGATTAWERFDPKERGAEHYAMYGRPFGRSLCHAWGGGPLYLFGRYLLGVHPTAPKYATFEVEPYDGEEAFEGVVPTPEGDVEISVIKDHLSVLAHRDGGTLIWRGRRIPLMGDEEVRIPR